MTNQHQGSTFDSFLEEEGFLEEVELSAMKRVIAYELEQMMKKEKISKSAMAARMHTSRAALDRLLDPKNTSMTLHTLVKTAHIFGKKLELSFVN